MALWITRSGSKRVFWSVTACRTKLRPVLSEDVVEHEHRHIATHAVAATGDGFQFFNHGGARSWIGVIELGGVSPRREKRVLALSDPARPENRVLAKRARLLFRALDESLRGFLQPRMVKPGVVRDKIQNELHAGGVEFVS